MKRRSLFKTALLSCLPLAHSNFANAAEFRGKYLLSLQADGGWDVTLFCDPKVNVAGEKAITNWSDEDEIQEVGNIKYAPFAKNKEFFEKHYKNLLVINGVDFQTNAHGIGVTNSWSGRTAAGYPSLGALYAAAENYTTNLPMPYLSFGGYSFSANLLLPTIVSNPGDLRNLVRPQVEGWEGKNKIDDDYYDLIKTMLIKDGINKNNDISALRGSYERRAAYLKSIQNFDKLEPLGELLPDRNEMENGNLKQQAQIALTSFKAGVTISADISQGGLDSHDNNDPQQMEHLTSITETLDYIWDYAEELGIADRLVVFAGSDFSRTPYYNSANGKDHWNISSYMVMEKNVNYTNQTIGETDEGQNAFKLSPKDNLRDDRGAALVTAHIHEAMRNYLGIGNDPASLRFPINNSETFDFFS